MKTKTLLLLVLFAAGLFVSCSGDNDPINEKSGNKTESGMEATPVETFRMAINEMNKPHYLPTEEYARKHGDELSPERKAILFNPAVNLIHSMGGTGEGLPVKTMADTNRILNKAFKIYISKTTKK